MRTVWSVACFAYWILLTVLLLAPDPAAVVGLQQVPIFPWGDIGVHFIFFTVLAILVHGTRWPKRVAFPVAGVLLGYGIVAESLQAFVPQRTVELLDYTENILGVAAGTAGYWLVQRTFSSR